MALIGWAGGNTFIDYIEPFDHWLAFGLLGFIGGKMVKESFGEEDVEKKSAGLTSIMVLLTLAVATSIDSLAAGLSLAFLKVNIYTAVITIGLTAFIITLLSMYLGKKLNVLVGKRAETAGGIILIGIGVKILLEHLL